MSPRKKSKPNPKAPATATASSTGPDTPVEPSSIHATSGTASAVSPSIQDAQSTHSVAPSALAPSGPPTPAAPGDEPPNKKANRKWLGGTGSWRSKAPAIVKTAKESIGVAGGATSELPSDEAKKAKAEGPTRFLTKRKSSKGDSIPASMTKLNVSSDGSVDQTPSSREPPKEPTESPIPKVNEPPLPPDPPKQDPSANTWGWRSWWSRPDDYTDSAKTKGTGDTEDAQRTPLPGGTPSEEADANSKELGSSKTLVDLAKSQDTIMNDAPTDSAPKQDVEMEDAPREPVQAQDAEMKDASADKTSVAAKHTSTSSWFWMWSSAQNAQANTDQPSDQPPEQPPEQPPKSDDSAPRPDAPKDTMSEPQKPAQQTVTEPVSAPEVTEMAQKEPPKSSSWAFWFKGNPKEDNNAEERAHKQVGEVAVYNTPSQSHPEAAQFNEEQPKKDDTKAPPEPPAEEPAPKRSFMSLRGRPKNKGTPKDTPTDTPSSSKTATPAKTSPAPSPTRPAEPAPPAKAAPKQSPTTKQREPNLVFPEFRNTYRMVQKPTYWQQIRKYFLGNEEPTPHLHINPAPPRIKKAVAIGIHGYFPAAIFQKIMGQPTGTSIRFANAAAAAIKDWTEARGYEADIEQIALEGEGFIAERVSTLWKLLLNWIEHIKAADFILVACHSQGVPVATMLVAKLIQFGCVSSARIGICAMAGINMGPFIEYKTKYFGPTAAELFEFSNPKSLVSQMYLAGLDEVLRFGVRILYVGSIDDQLVSLESSTFSNLSHPYIYRAVFVDGRIHAPDFLTHLVGFTLKLRNLGLPDHGLIRELSPALAGSLYGGEGHSRVYEDPRVYELAVQHALETTSLPVQPQPRPSTSGSLTGINIPVPGAKIDEKDIYALRVKDYDNVGSGNTNPYFLPWAMRGLLEEDFVKKALGKEVDELLGMFEDWKPTNKQLKDVKFRLEGVRSKL